MSNPTPSSKDTLLQNYDILVHIFSFFIPSDPSLDTGKWRRQLLNLALVSKAFLGPALDCLWSHVESLEPLFKLHPALCKVLELYVSAAVSLFIRQIRIMATTVFSRRNVQSRFLKIPSVCPKDTDCSFQRRLQQQFLSHRRRWYCLARPSTSRGSSSSWSTEHPLPTLPRRLPSCGTIAADALFHH
jgi:hypothetical protein